MSEHTDQCALIHRVRLETPKRPLLELLFAIPNGGARDGRTGAMLKAEGVKPGVPDLCLPVARGLYHGLYIELKIKGKEANKTQIALHAKLREQGYRVMVYDDWMEAWGEIESYLDQV